MFFFNISIDFWAIISFNIGFVLFLIGLLVYMTLKFEQNFWPTFYFTLILLAIILGIPIVLMNLIDITGIQKMQEIYITVNLAILSFTFAGIALSKDVLPIFKKESPSYVFENFKNYIVITTFNLIMLIFAYCFSLFKGNYNELMTVKIGAFNIQTINMFFWVTTVFTIIAIANMMYYTILISEQIVAGAKKN
jgi:hypothetical protein